MGDLSAHFSRHELECPCCGKYIYSARLLALAEKVRAILGKPMAVHSGTRCPAHNAKVGGSPHSQHLLGRALDFHVSGLSPRQTRDAILAAAKRKQLPELGGIGLYDWGVHIDVHHAQDGHLRKWDLRKRR